VEISNARAIVTGAARGLGYCFALELLRRGASVTAGDVNEQGLKQLLEAAAGLPGRLWIDRVDVRQEPSVSEFVLLAEKQMGMINVLVNNAAVLRDGWIARPDQNWIKKLPTPQWRQVLDTNLSGPFLMAREALAHILEHQISPAVIVNISSASRSGNPGQSNYSASKAGLDALTRTWALELAPFGIRVGGIAPGVVETPMLESVEPNVLTQLLDAIPLRRVGKPFEIWLALKFILECDYFTGRTIEVDGGSGF
jgi:3-oxoacyl-[acyl-carrier protein] reductase